MNPLVSVIMPFLNAEQHLTEAIESVRAQTFRNWELLLVDDGSFDDGPRIAARFVRTEPDRIRLLSPDPTRRGAAAARNRGMAVARGAFIAFLDADDLYAPSKLATDLNALDTDPASAWAYGATRWFYDDRSRRDWTERPGVQVNRSYDPPHLLTRVLLRDRGDIPCTCGVMLRKEAVEVVGGFEERFALYEDQVLWAKLMLRFRTRITPGCHALYRQHSGSTSSAAAKSGDYDQIRPHRARRAFLEWLFAYSRENGATPDVLNNISLALAVEDRAPPFALLARRIRRASRRLPMLP